MKVCSAYHLLNPQQAMHFLKILVGYRTSKSVGNAIKTNPTQILMAANGK